MRYSDAVSHTSARPSAQAINKTLRNTYGLLSLTLLFSAFTAGLSMALQLPHPGLIITLVGFYGLLFLTSKLRNSAWGILAVFALTGFMGLTLGPIISLYLSTPHGGSMVMSAMAMTGMTFLGLSAYAIFSKKDFSFLSGFITVGFFVLLFAMIVSFFVALPALQMAMSAGFALFSAMIILWQTSEIVRGGETNYIEATVTLYVSIYNMFLSLLSLMGMASDD